MNFKIVLSLAQETFADFLAYHQLDGYRPEEIQGLYLNFHYDGSTLQCITGISMHTFTLDKTLEHEWDEYVQTLLAEMIE